jgi:hypothetical protein
MKEKTKEDELWSFDLSIPFDPYTILRFTTLFM